MLILILTELLYDAKQPHTCKNEYNYTLTRLNEQEKSPRRMTDHSCSPILEKKEGKYGRKAGD